jgi:5-methyltetrahydropteroyltriglutamate--homocysteine methyltransferase
MSTTNTDAAPVRATLLGYPRIGRRRELKRATEAYWAGTLSAAELLAAGARLRGEHWQAQRDAGIDQVPCNDFSLYDAMLDAVVLVGAVPPRFRRPLRAVEAVPEEEQALHEYFAMARGTDTTPPLEMTKWFDTNYHYLVPELSPETRFGIDPRKPLRELAEAQALGLDARPVLIGPVTFLLLSKPAREVAPGFQPLSLLPALLEAYAELLERLQAAGASWVQLDEPALARTLGEAEVAAAAAAYRRLGGLTARSKLLVATYFDTPVEVLPVLRDTAVEGVALDLTAPGDPVGALAATGGMPGKRLVAGVVDGRNVWVNDLQRSLSTLGTLLGLADEVVVAPSCSLQHVPYDTREERTLPPEIARWLSFAEQKLVETAVLARGLTRGADSIRGELAANAAALQARRVSSVTADDAVRARAAAVGPGDVRRASAYPDRAALQQSRLGLPLLPTTTIGSFPQTESLRAARAALRRGELSAADYRTRMADEIRHVVELQERIGLDVLVHGEPERNDMVQYFAEQLRGYLATQHGWVQSYGTRCVRPPLLVGDVSRPAPMTVGWATYAAGLTDRPTKGMLTGPVTMLAWSFVRDDQPLAETARQVALALREEVADLERAGIGVIQVDEPALRELLPNRRERQADYLAWATEAFRLATSGVRDDTQIHTHMCYAEFAGVMPAIIALDADVISLEAARSGMQVAAELGAAGYPNEVGPGVYDIHSPRVPEREEVVALLREALRHLPAQRLWVNPDCGLKTRREAEVEPALRALVTAARELRRGEPAGPAREPASPPGLRDACRR